jgi:hypothetical protein
LQSITFGALDFFTIGVDTEDNIKVPFEKMGYTMYLDEKATTPNALNEYAKGKQIWYSLSHGSSSDGTPHTDFEGLNFIDAEKEGSITREKLLPLGLNYRLVILDGCMSAQTNKSSLAEAIQSNVVLPSAASFSQAFGSNAAYVGWCWAATIDSSQLEIAKLVKRMKGKPSLRAAYEEYIKKDIPGGGERSSLKIHGKIDNRIDLNFK